MALTLPNRKMETHINKVCELKLKSMNKDVVKMQAHILTYINDDRRNIIHLACLLGDHQLLEFLVQKAELLEIKQ